MQYYYKITTKISCNIVDKSHLGQSICCEKNFFPWSDYPLACLFYSCPKFVYTFLTHPPGSGASAWDESIGFLIKCIMIDLILHEFKIIQDQWISFEIWTLNPWFCEVNYYFKYMAEECFMPVLAKLSVCDGKNGITMYCVFQ